ncbi:MAG: hypothetical protein KDJ16_13050 [Hyphomicrobiales bacterium]|nr:hypothetical protein [Hyphomicrobiales bacterium]
MRILVFILVGLQVIVTTVLMIDVLTMSSDPAGEAMAQGIAAIFAILTAMFGMPALLLALFNRYLVIALILALIMPVTAIALLGPSVLR